MEAKSNRHPLRFVSIQADAAGSDSVYAPNANPLSLTAPTGKELVCLMPFLKFLWYFSIFLPDLRKKCVCVFFSICFGRNCQAFSQEQLPPGFCALLVLNAQARQSL